jgi:integrase
LTFLNAANNLQQQFCQQEDFHNAENYVFTSDSGNPLSYTNINRKLDEIAIRMGRPDITAHTLRHTFMTVSVRCGENLNEIQSEVGHGFTSDVITEYLHQTEESRHESAQRRQEYLDKIMEKYGNANSNQCE